MNSNSREKRIKEALATLAATHARAVADIERAIEGLSYVLEIQERLDNAQPTKVGERPRADRDTLSVVWRNKTCFLGNTLPFLLFERLARSPNRYVSHVDLLEDVWGGDREASTIRGVAKRLRDRLHEEGMGQLAEAIDGSVTGYYGLKLV